MMFYWFGKSQGVTQKSFNSFQLTMPIKMKEDFFIFEDFKILKFARFSKFTAAPPSGKLKFFGS